MGISIQTLYKHGFNMKSHFDWEFELVLIPNPTQMYHCGLYHFRLQIVPFG